MTMPSGERVIALTQIPREPLLTLDFSRPGILRTVMARPERISTIRDAITRWLDAEL